MNVLIVYAHPEPTSFNGALRDRAVGVLERLGHQVAVSDLYADGFDPRAGRHDFTTVAGGDRFDYQAEQVAATDADAFSPPLDGEQARLLASDLLILQFPALVGRSAGPFSRDGSTGFWPTRSSTTWIGATKTGC